MNVKIVFGVLFGVYSVCSLLILITIKTDVELIICIILDYGVKTKNIFYLFPYKLFMPLTAFHNVDFCIPQFENL